MIRAVLNEASAKIVSVVHYVMPTGKGGGSGFPTLNTIGDVIKY